MPHLLHFSKTLLIASLALGLTTGIPAACAQSQATSTTGSKADTVSASQVHIVTTDDANGKDIRIEKRIKDGKQTIALWIDGKEFHPADDEELEKILTENGVGDVKVLHRDDAHVIINLKELDDLDHVIQLDGENIRKQLELTGDDVFRLDGELGDLTEALGQLHELKLDTIDGMGNVIVQLQSPHALTFTGPEGLDITALPRVEPPKAMLGVQLEPVSQDLADYLELDADRCAYIAHVVEDSPAAKAGLKDKDIITGIRTPDDDSIQNVSVEELRSKIGQCEPGTKITLAIVRKGDHKEIKVKLDKWDAGQLGMVLEENEAEENEEPGEANEQPRIFQVRPMPRGNGQAQPNMMRRTPMMTPPPPGAPADLQRQLDQMRRQLEHQMQQLQQMMEQLQQAQQQLEQQRQQLQQQRHPNSTGGQPEA